MKKRRMKNLTYYNLLRVTKMIKAKGYSDNEAIHLAKLKFAGFNPNGMPIEEMVRRMLTAEEYEKEYGHAYIIENE